MNGRRYLFIHTQSTTFLRNVKRVINRPTPASQNPVLAQDRSWEKGSISNYGTVLYDHERRMFRFWYLAVPGTCGVVMMDGKELPASRTLLCYAESDDGLSWRKPNLGQVDFDGSRDNNIVSIGRVNVEGAAIFHDLEDPDPSRRFKALYWEHGSDHLRKREDGLVVWAESGTDGIWVSFSPDGLHWTNHTGNPVIRCWSDTSHAVVKNPVTGRYAAFGRFGFGRVVAQSESSDFLNWSPPQLVLETDDNESSGPYPDTQFYGMSVCIYEGLYLGGLWVYRPGADGNIETQLACSLDGRQWERVGQRGSFLGLELARPGDGMIRTAPNFLVRNDQIYIYYGLVSGPHAGPKHPRDSIQRAQPPCIALATLRRDGFVSLDAGDEAGMVLTKPFRVTGKSLHLNIRVDEGGEAFMILCSQTPDPVAEAGRSEIVQGDHTNLIVRWPDLDWSTQSGQLRRLRFHLRNAKLFSFWFE
jgi:hypothetical protein